MEKKGRLGRNSSIDSKAGMVGVDMELITLGEALRSQHQALLALQAELEEERNASATSANETMAMILRLQKEKAAITMEANQYKRLSEERVFHLEESLAAMEETIYRKDQEIASLEFEIQAYRHRLLSIGLEQLAIDKIKWPGRKYPDRDEEHMCSSAKANVIHRHESLQLKKLNGGGYCSSDDMEHGIDRKGHSVVYNERDGDNYNSEELSVDSFENGAEITKRYNCKPDYKMMGEEDDASSIWKHIEKLQNKQQQLARRRGNSCYIDEEWMEVSKELQNAVAAYTSSIKQGTMGSWRASSAHNNEIVDNARQGTEDLQLPISWSPDEENAEELLTQSEFGNVEGSATDGETSKEETDSNHNVHDVHVVQYECGRNESGPSHGFVAEDRLGKPDPLPQKVHNDIWENPRPTEMNLTESNADDAHKLVEKKIHDALPPKKDPLLIHVEELSKRLQSLEVDRELMQQTISNLRKEKEDLPLPKKTAEENVDKAKVASSAPNTTDNINKSASNTTNSIIKSKQEDQSVVRFMKGIILPFGGSRGNTDKVNANSSQMNVGLSHVLEEKPLKQVPSFVKRVVRVDSFTK